MFIQRIRPVFMEIQFLKLQDIKVYVKSVNNSEIQPLQCQVPRPAASQAL